MDSVADRSVILRHHLSRPELTAGAVSEIASQLGRRSLAHAASLGVGSDNAGVLKTSASQRGPFLHPGRSWQRARKR